MDKIAEQALTFINRNPSFTHSVNYINQIFSEKSITVTFSHIKALVAKYDHAIQYVKDNPGSKCEQNIKSLGYLQSYSQ